MNLAVSPDAQPEAGHYFRSDHFSFAHAGIPAFSIGRATQFAGKPADYGEKAYQEYNSKHYHQPSDEFQADWDFTALQQAAEYGFLLGTRNRQPGQAAGLASGRPVPPVRPGGGLTACAGSRETHRSRQYRFRRYPPLRCC